MFLRMKMNGGRLSASEKRRAAKPRLGERVIMKNK